jgi:hypothetical protein
MSVSVSTSELYKYLEILINTDIPVFIHGSPGIGKSYIVADIAKKKGLELIDIRLSQLDPVDLRGIPSIKENQTVWMPPVFFPKDENSQGILFLDELNSAAPSVQAAVYQLILNRQLGEYKLPEGWRIIAAGNRMEDKGVVFRLPSPLVNRMVHLYVEAKYEDFKQFALKNGLHHYIIGFLGFRPDLLSTDVVEDDSNPAFATPRSYHMLSNILKHNDNINEILPLIYGAIGYSCGIEFVNYVKIYENLPNPKSILNGEFPEIDKTNASLLFALESALVEYYDCSDIHRKNIFEFTKKLPNEFSVMLIKDLIVKDEKISETVWFEEWLSKYGEYII